jgi:signal transduction histidine kinase
MRTKAEQEVQALVEFLNQCPFGIIKADFNGQISMQNAAASQLLMPYCAVTGCDVTNIFSVIGSMNAEWLDRIQSYDSDFGKIIENERVSIQFPNQIDATHLVFTVIRIKKDVFQYTILDVSARVKVEEELNALAEASALEAGKLEMATGVLHDIGNAITSFGTDVAKLKGKAEGKEKEELLKLEGLFKAQELALDKALGKGKGLALQKFITLLRKSLEHREERFSAVVDKLYQTTSHIQEILNIQRSYVKGKTHGERASFKLSTVIEDALAIQEGGLIKRDVKIIKDIPIDNPPIKGDKTKLIQVLINAFKNSAEAYDELNDEREKHMHIRLHREPESQMVVLSIKDNAIGFKPALGETLLEKGNTHKKTGTGFGLYNCKQIIETHQGTISLTSKGLGCGAEFIIQLPYLIEAS